jgi:hypothetical protein
LDNGGEAPLTEIAEVVARLFRNHREYGEHILSALTPKCVRDSNGDSLDLRANKSLMLI